MSAFFFRRIIFLCFKPVFFPPFILADIIIFFFWNQFCIPEYNELLHYTTEDKVVTLLFQEHTCCIICTGIKLKLKCPKPGQKTIFLLLKARKVIQSTVTSKQQQNKYLVDCGKPMFSLLVTSINAKNRLTKHILIANNTCIHYSFDLYKTVIHNLWIYV